MQKHSKIPVFLMMSFISINSAFATCSINDFDELGQISAISKALVDKDNFLNKPDVKKSPCKTAPPTQEEMLAYLAGKNTGKTKKKTIAGVELKDDEELLKVFGQIHDKDPKYPQEPWRYTKGTKVSAPLCKEVLCAMKSIYGDELGVQILFMRSKFGFNSSHLGVGEGDAWPVKDFGTVLSMLNDFPSSMFPVKEGTRFVYVDADGRGGHRMVAESLVHVYRPWHNLPESEKTTSLAHEVGHLFAIDRKNTPEWLGLSDWTSKKLPDDKIEWTMGKPETAVLGYARTNPDEDFGETFFMYRYNGAALKEKHPGKYQYMKNYVFNGAEFDSEENCK